MMSITLPARRAPAVVPSHPRGLFRVGDERFGNKGSIRPEIVELWARRNPGKEEELKDVLFCPYSRDWSGDLYRLQNIVNCGKLFRPRLDGEGRMVPYFVRPGYEDLYKENNRGIWTYSKAGMPYHNGECLLQDTQREARHAAIWEWVREGLGARPQVNSLEDGTYPTPSRLLGLVYC